MKKTVIIVFAIAILFLVIFSLVCLFQKNKLNEQVICLSTENAELKQKIKIYDNKNEELKNQFEMFCNVDEQYKHPIDIEFDNCINSIHPYMYSDCAKQNAENWNNEIEKQLHSLKKIMKASEYKLIEKAQADWKKSITEDEQIINEFIINQQGQINETIGFSNLANLKKQRALFLKSIHSSYMD